MLADESRPGFVFVVGLNEAEECRRALGRWNDNYIAEPRTIVEEDADQKIWRARYVGPAHGLKPLPRHPHIEGCRLSCSCIYDPPFQGDHIEPHVLPLDGQIRSERKSAFLGKDGCRHLRLFGRGQSAPVLHSLHPEWKQSSWTVS